MRNPGSVVSHAETHQPENIDGHVEPTTDFVGKCEGVKKVFGLISGDVF
jgi:hypothetical protein